MSEKTATEDGLSQHARAVWFLGGSSIFLEPCEPTIFLDSQGRCNAEMKRLLPVASVDLFVIFFDEVCLCALQRELGFALEWTHGSRQEW